MSGTIDAFIKIQHADNSLRTKVVIPKENQLRWDQEMLLPLEIPLTSSKLVFEVYDKEEVLADKLVCSMEFQISELLKNDCSCDAD